MAQYAYARVSSKTQNLARQTDCFLALGIPKNNIYSDKLSGKDFDRKNYERLLRKLRRDDVLVVSSIDRLGRNYDMILKEWTRITKTIGADVIVLDMPLLDTRAQTGDLTGRFVADLVLQILSYVAQKERENIKERQREGIASAKKTRRAVRPPFRAAARRLFRHRARVQRKSDLLRRSSLPFQYEKDDLLSAHERTLRFIGRNLNLLRLPSCCGQYFIQQHRACLSSDLLFYLCCDRLSPQLYCRSLFLFTALSPLSTRSAGGGLRQQRERGECYTLSALSCPAHPPRTCAAGNTAGSYL